MPIAGLLRLAFAACLLVPGASALAQATAAKPTVAAAGAQAKELRYAFRVAETGFDPVQVNDLYSRIVLSNILDAPLAYDYLARPARLKPNVAALPEVSADFTTYTLKIRPGIHFADDPAFKGVKRELTAHDYVYSIKRFFDPRLKSPGLAILETERILGLPELRREALKTGRFDYDRPVEGVRALDRYTLQIRLGQPSPRFAYYLADPSFLGAIAREVAEAYGDRIMEKPVGTGPFRLAHWKRSSKMVLERNPNYRDDVFDDQPNADDGEGQAIAHKLRGRKLPLVDRVVISVIEESQPRWLAFLGGEHDMIEEVPADFANIAFPNNELAPHLKRRGVSMDRYPRADVSLSLYNMKDPVVGGYEPAKVALRRAINLAVDVDQEIRLVRRNQAIPAQSSVGPGVSGYDPRLKTEMSEHDPARARALLDMFGYVDRNGDGWREQPDGSPLVLEYASQPDQQSRQLQELWKKNMDAIGVRIEFKIQKWPENLKASRAGKLQMWGVGWSAAIPDGDTFLALGYGPRIGEANHSRFDLPAYNALYEKQRGLPDGPEREAAFLEAKKLLVAYAPYKFHVHRIFTDLTHPWVSGAKRNIFRRDFWKYVDIDTSKLPPDTH